MTRKDRRRSRGGNSPRASERTLGRRPTPNEGDSGETQSVPDGEPELANVLLSGRSPSEILRRIASGDPLEMEARCLARLGEKAVLLDVGRLMARALARVAYAGAAAAGRVRVDELTADCIDWSIDELLEQDRLEERERLPVEQGVDPRHTYFAEALGIDSTKARRACVVFNDLPHRVRRAYWALVIEGRTIESCAAAGMGSHEEIEALLKRALLTLSLLEDPGQDHPAEARPT